MRFLPTITTTPGSDWKSKIKNCFLEEICIFLTLLSKEQRTIFYNLLKKSTVKSIPFVHIRDDMNKEELVYLKEKYGTVVFNIHSGKEYPFLYNYEEINKDIFIENVYVKTSRQELSLFGGLCLDFAHLENDRLTDIERYEYFIDIISDFKIGCNHISAVNPHRGRPDEKRGIRFDSHYLEDLSELSYLDNYPKHYFSNYCALELENSLQEQVDIVNYLTNRYLS